MRKNSSSCTAFTLIELVTVIVILGVLSVFAVPMYLDYARDAKASACRGALGALRSGIANYRIFCETPAGGGAPSYPTIDQLGTPGVIVQGPVPGNVYDTDSSPNNLVDATGQTKGTIVGTTKGWAYNPTTGEIWANSSGGKASAENTF